MLLIFILSLAATALLVDRLNTAAIAQQQNEKTMLALAEAKAALINWSVSHPDIPGLLPYPDRNNDGDYDDTSDCYTSSFKTNFVLGRLPLFKSPGTTCIAAGAISQNNGVEGDFRDGTGERLWYEASRNLLYDYNSSGKAPVINPGIANAPAYPWLVVLDRNGGVMSNRVAAVIMASGLPSGSQDRTGGIANPNQYLDKVVMADGTPYQNYGYADPAVNPVQAFIVGDDFRTVAKNDPRYKNQALEPYYFNDKLVYITIDELMTALEARAAMEAKFLLNAYKAKNGKFPNADLLGSTNYASVTANTGGILPINITDVCTCSASTSCSCSFGLVDSVAFKRSSGTWSATNISGACSLASSTTCKCSGTGYCKNTAGTNYFTCDAAGLCTHNATGSYTYTPQTYADVFSASTGCTKSANTAVCNNTGSFALGLNESGWFKANSWQDYFYYRWSAAASLQAGSHTGISALLIAVGSPIASAPYAAKASAQVRPSTNLNDYLDSAENSNGNDLFEATNKSKSTNYNDQIVVVAP